MAQGINNRVRLALPMSGSEEDTRRQLMRWANGLPFGRAGFHVSRSTNDSAVANTSILSITFNTRVDDAENWWTPGASTMQTFTVPAGLSGVYQFDGALYAGTFATSWFAAIHVNGVPVARSGSANDDVRQVSALHPLNEGDTVALVFSNFSGGSLTPNAVVVSSVNPAIPYLRAYRMSLL